MGLAAGDLLTLKQDFAAAEQEFNAQLAVNAESSVVYTQIATARARQDNVEGAVQAFKDGLVALPDDQRLLLGLAGLYGDCGYRMEEQEVRLRPIEGFLTDPVSDY